MGICGGCFAGVDPKPVQKAEKPKPAPADTSKPEPAAVKPAEKPPAPAPKKEEPKPAAAAPKPAAAAETKPPPQSKAAAPAGPTQDLAAEPTTLPRTKPATTTPAAAPAAAAVAAVTVSQPAASAPAAQAPDAAAAQAPMPADLGVGSSLEVYSNSYGAWCPGVVHGLDDVSILVTYQVPGEPADASISTKTLPVDSPEIRGPVDTGAWLTASVEVYSHSNNCWCLGKITEINEGVMSVVFFYPNEPPDSIPVMKKLPFADRDLRLRGIESAFMPAQDPAALGHDTLKVGSTVEVYSNSMGLWCQGSTQNIAEDGMVTIAFFYPDMDPQKDEPALKELPLGHQDFRVPAYLMSVNNGPPVSEEELKKAGEVEVFSQSRGIWIKSQVKEVIDGNVTLSLRYPDMPEDAGLFEKILPVGHGDIRLVPSA